MTSAALTLKLLFANRVPLPSHTLPLSTFSAAVESVEPRFAVFEQIVQLIKSAFPLNTKMPPAACVNKANGQEQSSTTGARLFEAQIAEAGSGQGDGSV